MKHMVVILFICLGLTVAPTMAEAQKIAYVDL